MHPTIRPDNQGVLIGDHFIDDRAGRNLALELRRQGHEGIERRNVTCVSLMHFRRGIHQGQCRPKIPGMTDGLHDQIGAFPFCFAEHGEIARLWRKVAGQRVQ